MSCLGKKGNQIKNLMLEKARNAVAVETRA